MSNQADQQDPSANSGANRGADSSSLDARQQRAQVFIGHVVKRSIPLVVLLLVLGAAYWFWRITDPAPEPESGAHSPDPVAVSVVVVEPVNTPFQLRFLGQTEASQIVELRARVSGFIDDRLFTEGDPVSKNQKLFEIDPEPFQVELDMAEASLASAEATKERATQQVRRYQELAAQQSATMTELEDWQTQERVAVASVSMAKAQVAAATLQRGYTTIKSPIDGMIGRSLMDTGSYVDTTQNSLLAIVEQVDPIYIRYSVTEQEMLRFQRQADAGSILVPDLQDLELEVILADGSVYPRRGKINFIDVRVDESTGTSVVRGEVANPDGVLKPGQFVYANIIGVERVQVLRVPQRAVQQSPAGASVLVVNVDGVADSRPVVLGDWLGTEYWIIERGLNPGDRVIVDRLMMVRPGTPVTVDRVVSLADPAPAQKTEHDPRQEPPGDPGVGTSPGRGNPA